MLIDTHAHLNFAAFENDFEEVIRRAQKEGVEKIINVGADLDSSQKALEIAQNHEGCFASVGIHPHHAESHLDLSNSIEVLKKLAEKPKVVAIGECGLDNYSYKEGGVSNPEKQAELFLAHLDLAQQSNLPLIIHNREAHQNILKILDSFLIRGVFHCFSGDENFLREVLNMGFYVGFDGNITYKSAQNLRDWVRATPIERLLLETDSPYLSPEPLRGLRNEPGNVKIVAGAVAEVRQLPFEVVAEKTSQNARALFSL